MKKRIYIIIGIIVGVVLTPVIVVIGGFTWYILVIEPFCSEDDIACWERECTSNDHTACDEYFEKHFPNLY